MVNHPELNTDWLDRSVYAIRLKGKFVIRYPGGISPLLYIGEGNFTTRLGEHWRNWMKDLAEQNGFAYTIWVCQPRIRNIYEAYKSVEAHLLDKFRGLYGTIPLYNSQLETQWYKYSYDPAFYDVFRIGKGHSPKWAIMPCRSHPCYRKYFKGFDWEKPFKW